MWIYLFPSLYQQLFVFMAKNSRLIDLLIGTKQTYSWTSNFELTTVKIDAFFYSFHRLENLDPMRSKTIMGLD